jgi:hypothetical protein
MFKQLSQNKLGQVVQASSGLQPSNSSGKLTTNGSSAIAGGQVNKTPNITNIDI